MVENIKNYILQIMLYDGNIPNEIINNYLNELANNHLDSSYDKITHELSVNNTFTKKLKK